MTIVTSILTAMSGKSHVLHPGQNFKTKGFNLARKLM